MLKVLTSATAGRRPESGKSWTTVGGIRDHDVSLQETLDSAEPGSQNDRVNDARASQRRLSGVLLGRGGGGRAVRRLRPAQERQDEGGAHRRQPFERRRRMRKRHKGIRLGSVGHRSLPAKAVGELSQTGQLDVSGHVIGLCPSAATTPAPGPSEARGRRFIFGGSERSQLRFNVRLSPPPPVCGLGIWQVKVGVARSWRGRGGKLAAPEDARDWKLSFPCLPSGPSKPPWPPFRALADESWTSG